MQLINVDVRNKIATQQNKAVYVCGNSDYIVRFGFDAEWDEYEKKTARFEYGGTYQDVVFTGNECPVPIISDTYSFNVGVYAGDLCTTTPAYIACKKSILCGAGVPADPVPDVYSQVMNLLNSNANVYVGSDLPPENAQVWINPEAELKPEDMPGGGSSEPGKDGVSPIVTLDETEEGVNITITDVEGVKTATVKHGQFTEADKADMVQAVIAALPVYGGETE